MRRVRGGAGLRVVLGLVVFAVLAAAGIAWRDYARFTQAPLAIPVQGDSLIITKGSSFSEIVNQFRRRHLSAAPRLYWRVLAEQMGVTGSLHAGEYALDANLTPRSLLRNLAQGKVLQHQFTIVDGWTFRQLREALATAELMGHPDQAPDDDDIMQAVGGAGENPEGRFLPETYAYTRGDSEIDILRRAYHDMQTVLASAWAGRAEDLPLETPYQALILASIVEKETGRADERARIAGVFIRRLQIGMPLATDPTIIYGMGSSYQGNIRKRDLSTDTPYNTYMHAGLPPTPIALPGKAAIAATLHPADGKDLYFVARSDGSGSHVFSATLAEHNRAVACYQLKRCR